MPRCPFTTSAITDTTARQPQSPSRRTRTTRRHSTPAADSHCLIDQFIKNTYEVLSPLGRLTALMEMTDHQFLTENRLVERTRFGTDVNIVVNFSDENFTWQDTVIPPRGFAIDSPSLKAFCALRYAGVDYSEPTLFVLWARDGKSLEQSDDVRIYHGFGEPRVQFRDDILNVKTPETLVPTTE